MWVREEAELKLPLWQLAKNDPGVEGDYALGEFATPGRRVAKAGLWYVIGCSTGVNCALPGSCTPHDFATPVGCVAWGPWAAVSNSCNTLPGAGRLFQVEYAMSTIDQFGLAMGILTRDPR